MEEKLIRKCPNPECSHIIYYANISTFRKATKENRKCKRCFKNPNPELFFEETLQRKCPNEKCGKIIDYSSRASWLNAIKRNVNCSNCVRKGSIGWSRGLKKETDIRVANIGIGLSKTLQENKENGIERVVWCRGLTKETDDRLKFRKENPAQFEKGHIPWNLGLAWEDRENPPPFLGRKHSEETKDIIRTKRAERFIEQNIGPAYNKSTVDLFKRLDEELNFNGIFATKPKEYYVEGLGFWVDYYEPNFNIVIEYYETHHNRKKRIERDLIRMDKIINKLNCDFYIIKEWETKSFDDIVNEIKKIKEMNIENNEC